ncbi:MAG: helix-turn-helix domain-containing protein [Patescibacteria group bacterium]
MVLIDAIQEKLNLIKSHPDPLSQAQMLAELKASNPIQNKDIAEYLGMKPSNVSHLLRVTKLPEIVLDGYVSKQISFTHLILISRLKKHDEIVNLYEEILKNGYTALQTERRIREILYLVDNYGNYVNKHKIQAYEERIEKSIGDGAKATIIQTRIKAKVIIEITGNLAKTTEFIESFSARFRSKRSQSEVQKDQNDNNGDTSMSPSVGTSSDFPIGVEQSESLLSDEKSVDVIYESTEEKKKYRFDPDF